MKIVEKADKDYTTKILVISHRFKNYSHIVCSGGKIYQLPKMVGKKSFSLKEILPKIHLGSLVYRIESKRVFASTLKKLSFKVSEEFVLEKEKICPF